MTIKEDITVEKRFFIGDVTGLIYDYNSYGWLSDIFAKTEEGNETLREYTYTTDGKVETIKDHRDFLDDASLYTLQTYDYDVYGRVTSLAYTDSKNTGEVKESYQATYDANGNITSENLYNGYPDGIITADTGDEEEGAAATTTSGKVDETRHYTYDSLGRLIKTNTEDRITNANETVNYAYDNVGNRVSETTGDSETTYTYNSLNQLTSGKKVEGKTISDDGSEVDNVTSQKTYLYDVNGNLTGESDSVTGEATVSAYDTQNMLTSLNKTVNGTVILTQNNAYNGEGQRIKKSETDGSGNETTTDYYYQNGAVLSTDTTTENTTVQSSFNLLGTESNVICSGRSDGQYYFYNKDLQGSTTNIIGTDSSGNAQSEVSYVYSDFGETTIQNSTAYRESAGSDFYNEICYTGGIYDQSTGLYYLNARYYNPKDGRFTTQDTYRGEYSEPETLHLYAYCSNDPINFIDPTGHWSGPMHVRITKSGYSKLKASSRKKIKGYMYDAMIGGCTTPDEQSAYKDRKYHGKYPALKDVKKAYRNLALLYYKMPTLINRTRAGSYLGIGLHTVQDYYAHNIWIKTYYGKRRMYYNEMKNYYQGTREERRERHKPFDNTTKDYVSKHTYYTKSDWEGGYTYGTNPRIGYENGKDGKGAIPATYRYLASFIHRL